jgi:hypothetical protein
MTSAPGLEPPPHIPGLTLLEPVLGRGNGEVWRAQDAAGCPVLVRVVRLRAEPALAKAARWRAAQLVDASQGLPWVEPVLEVRDFDDGFGWVRVDDESLQLRWRGQASRQPEPAYRVAVDGSRLAEALAGLHGRGLTHGRLTRADVLVDDAGAIRLTGFGVTGVLGAPGSPEADVAALARLLLRHLPAEESAADSLRHELAAVVEAGCPAAELADLCASFAAAASPVQVSSAAPAKRRAWDLGRRLVGRASDRHVAEPDPDVAMRLSLLTAQCRMPAPPGAVLSSTGPTVPTVGPAEQLRAELPQRPATAPRQTPAAAAEPLGRSALRQRPAPGSRAERRWWLRSGWRAAVVMSLLATVAAVVGWRTATPPHAGGQPPAAASCPKPVPAVAELTWLAAVRAQVFGQVSADLSTALASVDLAAGPASDSDLASLRALQVKGAHATGLHTRVERVRLVGCSPGRVQVAVVDAVDPYNFVDANGRVLASSPGHPRREHLITLAGNPGHWRYQEVAVPPA